MSRYEPKNPFDESDGHRPPSATQSANPSRVSALPRPTNRRFSELPKGSFLPTKTSGVNAKLETDESSKKLQALRYDYEALASESARKAIVQEEKIHALEAQLDGLNRKFDDSEADKRYLYEQQKQKNADLSNLNETVQSLKSKNESIQSSWKSEVSSVKEQTYSLREQLNACETALRTNKEQCDSQVEQSKQKSQLLEERNEELRKELHKKSSRINDLEQTVQTNTIEIEDLRRNGSNLTELEHLQKELKAQLQHSNDLEQKSTSQGRQIERLQHDLSEYVMLKEKHASLEARFTAVNTENERLTRDTIALEDLRREKNSWLAYLGDEQAGFEFKDPRALTEALYEYRAENRALKEQIDILKQQEEHTISNLSSLESQKRKLGEQITELESRLRAETSAKLRNERQKQLAVREVEYLRENLKSYDIEEAALMTSNYDKQKSERIEALTKLVDEYKERLDSVQDVKAEPRDPDRGQKRSHEDDMLEEALSELRRKLSNCQQELIECRKASAAYEQRLSESQKRVESLEKEKDSLKNALQAPRILQLAKNPTSTYHALKKAEFDNLKEENRILLERLRGDNTDADLLIPIQSLNAARAEIAELAQTVAEKDKRMERLKSIWSEKSSEFREAVYSLLGYKLDFLQNGRVRVTSMYAEQDDHAFIFDGESSTMQLVGGGNDQFMKSINNLVQFWCEERKTIPGMLAALTLEYFEQSTTGRGASWNT